MDIEIKKVLDEYKSKIDALKILPTSISSYTVDKPWGYEQWLELNEFYAFKLIFMKAGNQSSLQYHEHKYETNYVIKGKAKLVYEDSNKELKEMEIEAGDGWSVPIGKIHRVIAIEDYIALEVSTPHLNDVIRLEDDTNRKNGKIREEHA